MLSNTDSILELNKKIQSDVRKNDIRLLSVNSDPKTFKSFKSGKGFITGILYLAPYDLSGFNVCPNASMDCIKACLHTSGNPAYMKSKENARINKTRWFMNQPDVKLYKSNDVNSRDGFINRLKREILSLKNIAEKYELALAIRLNGTSDIAWEVIIKDFILSIPEVKFYDYTKSFKRATESLTNKIIHQTFSRSECNQNEVLEFLKIGGTVAVVFDKVPETWHGYTVIEGDDDDLRFLDDTNKKDGIGLVVGLKAKGKAIQQYKEDAINGFGFEDRFVVRINSNQIPQV